MAKAIEKRKRMFTTLVRTGVMRTAGAIAVSILFTGIAYAGVGGGVEAKEYIDIVPLMKFTLIFLAGLGAVFGLGLAFAAKRFAVQIDPRVEKVKDVLAHAHCGACGYAGCEQYAEAVVKNPDVAPNLCIPAGARGAEAVAALFFKDHVSGEHETLEEAL